MKESDRYRRSIYQTLTVLRRTASSTVELVECSLDGRRYIRKTYPEDKRALFAVLAEIADVHVPRIREVFFDADTVVIEEYIEGKTLGERIGEKYPFTRREIRRMMQELADALDTLHRRSVIHRDIKPENIIIREDGTAVLIDYSIARLYAEGRDADTALFGTIGYAAPEQFGFSQTDYRTDIYALGMTMKKAADPAGLSRPLKKVIARCVEFDPSKRFQTAAELKKALSAKKKLSITAIAAVLALVLSAAAVLLSPSRPTGFLSALSAQLGRDSAPEDPEQSSETDVLPPDTNKKQNLPPDERDAQIQAPSPGEADGESADPSSDKSGVEDADPPSDAGGSESIVPPDKAEAGNAVPPEDQRTETDPPAPGDGAPGESPSAQDPDEGQGLLYEPADSRIVRIKDDGMQIPCLQLHENGTYSTSVSLDGSGSLTAVTAVKTDLGFDVTVNGSAAFSFARDTEFSTLSYPNGGIYAEIVFYDLDGDGVCEIIPVLCDAVASEWPVGGVYLLKNYSLAWCIYRGVDGSFCLASGRMQATLDDFFIYASAPGYIWADFPSCYTFKDSELILYV